MKFVKYKTDIGKPKEIRKEVEELIKILFKLWLIVKEHYHMIQIVNLIIKNSTRFFNEKTLPSGETVKEGFGDIRDAFTNCVEIALFYFFE